MLLMHFSLYRLPSKNNHVVVVIIKQHFPCFYSTGRPEPTVTWLNGDEIMQTGGGISMGRHVTVNRLEIPKMTRSALNNTYKCQASNTKLVPPAERSIRVDMLRKCDATVSHPLSHPLPVCVVLLHLSFFFQSIFVFFFTNAVKPLSASLSSKPKQLISNQEYVLACNVAGSVPETDIKWMQNNRPFTKGKVNFGDCFFNYFAKMEANPFQNEFIFNFLFICKIS